MKRSKFRPEKESALLGGFRGSRSGKRRRTHILPVVFLLLGWGALYFLTGAACWVKALVGLPCPGCGTVRAFFALAHGDLAGALRWHPLILITVLILPLGLAGDLFLMDRLSDRQKKFLRKCFLCLSLLYLSVFLIRAIFYFPDTEPLDFYRNTLSRALLNWITKNNLPAG
jgi:hypothetical protein